VRHSLATVVLGPILLAQGRYVRRVTPRLPEAPGPREGVLGSGAPLRLLIAGDSAAAGVGAASQAQALSGRLAAALAGDYRVEWRLVARTGIGVRELVDVLEAEPARPFDVAVTSIGVNDVTAGTSVERWVALQGELVRSLESRFGVAQALLSSVPPMHRFPALPQPLRWYLGGRASRLNGALAEWARERRDCEFVPVEFPLEPGLIATDGFHPGPAGYAEWARHLAQRIRARRR
jgi:lysophospholipase L1-like esterase